MKFKHASKMWSRMFAIILCLTMAIATPLQASVSSAASIKSKPRLEKTTVKIKEGEKKTLKIKLTDKQKKLLKSITLNNPSQNNYYLTAKLNAKQYKITVHGTKYTKNKAKTVKIQLKFKKKVQKKKTWTLKLRVKVIKTTTPSPAPKEVTLTTKELEDASYTQGQLAVKPLDATVTSYDPTGAKDKGSLEFQWYEANSKTRAATDSAIEGATEATYTPSTSKVGVRYYYCAVTYTAEDNTYADTTVYTNVATIRTYEYSSPSTPTLHMTVGDPTFSDGEPAYNTTGGPSEINNISISIVIGITPPNIGGDPTYTLQSSSDGGSTWSDDAALNALCNVSLLEGTYSDLKDKLMRYYVTYTTIDGRVLTAYSNPFKVVKLTFYGYPYNHTSIPTGCTYTQMKFDGNTLDTQKPFIKIALYVQGTSTPATVEHVPTEEYTRNGSPAVSSRWVARGSTTSLGENNYHTPSSDTVYYSGMDYYFS